jgi:probable lipoprotein (TIGR04455 family)
VALALTTGCSAVRSSYVRPDYEQVDRQQVKRLSVVTQPLPEGKPAVGELWSLIARQWVNQNRDFLVKDNKAREAVPAAPTVAEHCVEGIEGVLWLEPQTKREGGGVEAQVKARLMRCSDGQDVWRAEAAGSWDSQDEKFRERVAQYVQQLGPDVEPYVVPSYKLLSATLDTLPNPQLNDVDIEEKIELGE